MYKLANKKISLLAQLKVTKAPCTNLFPRNRRSVPPLFHQSLFNALILYIYAKKDTFCRHWNKFKFVFNAILDTIQFQTIWKLHLFFPLSLHLFSIPNFERSICFYIQNKPRLGGFGRLTTKYWKKPIFQCDIRYHTSPGHLKVTFLFPSILSRILILSTHFYIYIYEMSHFLEVFGGWRPYTEIVNFWMQYQVPHKSRHSYRYTKLAH